MPEVTLLLQAIEEEDPRVADELLPLVYEALLQLAVVKMLREAAGQTLQPTALVHGAWLVRTLAPSDWIRYLLVE